MGQRVKYSDLGLKGANPTNVEAVMSGIRNILHTRIGERVLIDDLVLT